MSVHRKHYHSTVQSKLHQTCMLGCGLTKGILHPQGLGPMASKIATLHESFLLDRSHACARRGGGREYIQQLVQFE